MKPGFVEYTQIASEQELRNLFPVLSSHEPQASESVESFFFLRWLHKVSGLVMERPEQLSPEGQWLSAIAELRWKRDRNGYQLLWLGQQSATTTQPFSDLEWSAIDRAWETDDKRVLLHDRRTPQFPHLFNYPIRLENRLRQRYFRDAHTDMVHFVALTIHPAQVSADSPQSQSVQ